MRIRYLESFYGGSHRDVADGIVRHSRHQIELLTMPARYWRWRMRVAGIHFAREIQATGDRSAGSSSQAHHRTDLIVCTGLMSVADLAALLGASRPPILLYAHETQLVYPRPGGRRADRDADLGFAFTDLANMLAADHVVFNSRTHRRAFLDSLPDLLRRMPEYRPARVVDDIAHRSSVCYPGIRVSASATEPSAIEPSAIEPSAGPPLILWNHRWEYDKDPESFFAALRVARERGCAFRLALLGEPPGGEPREFAAARAQFSSQLVHYGYVERREAYEAWLRAADVVVSTAVQENFGISVVEAIAHGAVPLLPNRLSYPEIIPTEHHDCLYENGELPDRLCDLLGRPAEARRPPADLVAHARSFAWEERVGEFDALFEQVAGGARG